MKNQINYMTTTITIGVLFCVCISITAEPVAPFDDLEVRKTEVESMVKELPVKEANLKTKTYSGTIEEVLELRVVDVNEVYQYAKELNEKAVKVCEDMGLKVTKQEAVKKIVDAKKEKLERQKTNSEFLKDVNEFLNDPNVLPDVNDPNYAYEVERNQQFLLAVMEMCEPR